jgi:hypothetical protein
MQRMFETLIRQQLAAGAGQEVDVEEDNNSSSINNSSFPPISPNDDTA